MRVVQRTSSVSKSSLANIGAEARQIQVVRMSRFALDDIAVVTYLPSQYVRLTGHNDFVQQAQIIEVDHGSDREPAQALYNIRDVLGSVSA